MSRKKKVLPMVWNWAAAVERPAPTKAELEAVELEVVKKLSSLGGMAGISVALEVIAALLYAEDFRVGSKGLTRFLTMMVEFLVRRTRSYERSEELLPLDIRTAVLQ